MNIFEELMAGQSTLTEGVNRKSQKKTTKVESKKIPLNKLKVESMKILEDYEDYDELDDQFAKDPEEVEDGEVVLVIDPEANPNEEVPEDAAEDMVGDSVYKCPICGANYVCDCDAAKTEGIEVDENNVPTECPVCGDDAEQILIGEIAPAEGAGEEAPLDPTDVDDNDDSEDDTDDIEDEDIIEDSFKRRGARRVKENKTRRKRVKEDLDNVCPECGEEDCIDALELADPVTEEPAEPAVAVNADNVYIDFDEKKLESIMNGFLRENYKGALSFKVTKGTYRNGTLKLEYVVRSGRKPMKKGVLAFEGYNMTKRARRVVSLKGKDKGAFTESFTRKPAFILECVCVRNKIVPTSLKYNFTKRVNESLYRVEGTSSVAKSRKKVTEGVSFYNKSVGQDSLGRNMPWSHLEDLLRERVFQGGMLIYNEIMNGSMSQDSFDELKQGVQKIIDNPKVLKDPDNIYVAQKIYDPIKDITNVEDFGIY